MSNIKKIGVAIALALLSFSCNSSKKTTVTENTKPNVIYILADDLGYGEVGYNGQKMINTPELDLLAKNGLRFTDHYCGNAVCAASRAALMTGLHPGHAYIRDNSPGYPDGQTPLPKGTETVPKLMQRAGYTTGLIGKWGLGSINDSGSPLAQGFDHFYGFTDQVLAHNYYPEYLWSQDKKVMLNNSATEENDYSHDLLTIDALKFIQDNKKKPFFLYLAYTIPHVDYQVPDLAQYKDKDWPEDMKIHAAMTSRMDGDIGKIKRLLESMGISKNTIIMFNSDNGAHGQFGSADFFNLRGELRGLKRDMYDGGVRSPMIAYWPGTIKPGSVTDHISAFWDLLPTLSELTGVPVKGRTDGISLLPTLLGKQKEQKEHEYLYWELYPGKTPNQGVRYGKWKGVVADRTKGMNIELYDMSKSESEQKDEAKVYPEVVEQIRKMMLEAHEPSPFWDATTKPFFNLKAAMEASGLKYVPKSKKEEHSSAE
ncbi:arylsulfatase [Flavobacterium algicola]|uniref:arylsulfatase n=1 Tax=Flavobacterium algicola TaxID=556529 RepID=UPI001EFD77FA|nr:arylsulfatase [Flavobacterium algicola]MCG9793698.1 arylsulfatase [Flavobacterium algicola]